MQELKPVPGTGLILANSGTNVISLSFDCLRLCLPLFASAGILATTNNEIQAIAIT